MKHINYTKDRYLTYDYKVLVLGAFISLCFFTNLSVVAIDNIMRSSMTLFHVTALLLFPFLLFKSRSIILPNKHVCIFIGYIIVLSLFLVPRYGFSGLLFNVFFGAYIMIVFLTLFKEVSYSQWVNAFSLAGLIMLVAVNIRLLININDIMIFINSPHYRFYVATFIGGGVNLEATFLGMFCFFHMKKKWGILYLANCTLISSLYASRAGLIVNLLCLFWFIFLIKRVNLKNIFGMIGAIVVLLFFSFTIIPGIIGNMFGRLLGIGHDGASIIRLEMWEYSMQAFLQNPMGYGIGNGIVGISEVHGAVFRLNNIHNIYLQMLLDGGIIGFLYYIILIISFFVTEVKNRFNNPFAAAVASYFIVGFVQFRAVDVILAIFLGAYLCTRKKSEYEGASKPVGIGVDC